MAMVNNMDDTPKNSRWKKDRIKAMITENKAEFLAARAEQDAAKEQVLVLTATVGRLRQRKYELKRLMNDTTSIMSTLPRETVSEIFLTLSATMGVGKRGVLPIQLLIGRVCNEWREIAWATPGLWNKISIWFSPGRQRLAQEALVKQWIKRSGNHPLNLTIRSWPTTPRSLGEPSEHFFRLLLKTVHRWEVLDSIAFPNLAVTLRSKKDLRFSMLKTVRLHSYGDYNPDISSLKWSFSSAPLLRDLDIQAVLSERFLSINWSSLTRLSAHIGLESQANIQRCCISIEVLASCHSLSSLKCRILQSDNPADDQVLCHLLYLEEIELEAKGSDAAFFLQKTTTPALKKFDLTIQAGSDESQWMEAVVDLAKRSSFKLAILNLHFETKGGGDDAQIADMLRQLSRSNPIESLKLSYSSHTRKFYFSDSVVELFTMGADENDKQQREHFPLLSQFSFRGEASFDVEIMARMLKSRLKYEVRRSRPNKSIIMPDHLETLTKVDAEDKQGIHVDSVSHGLIAVESPTSTPLSIDIVYNNREWYESQNPNIMRSFYQAVEAFATEGRSFDLSYEEQL